MESVSSAKTYFPNLDALRFFAAILVVIHHVELYKSLFKMDNYYDDGGFVHIAGKVGVVLFFVLSGFLIFSLLIKERSEFGKVNTRKFYLRRILRIWPLYFLIVGSAFLIFPHISALSLDVQYAQSRVLAPVLYAAMLPNVACILYLIVPYAAQAWSLGIEEQIYLISPLVLNFFKNVGTFLLSIVGITLLIKLIVWGSMGEEWNKYAIVFNNFSYSCIAIGALTAYFYFHRRHRFVEFIFKPAIQIVVWLLTFFFLFSGVFFEVLQFEIFSVLFAIIILNLACNEKSLVKLEQPFLNYLGKISYGIYMYHAVVIVLVIRFLAKNEWDHPVLVYISVFVITTLVAAFSYEFFEKYFLRLKSSNRLS